MVLSHNQVGLAVSLSAAIVIGVICITLVVLKDRLPFTFSRRNPSSTNTDIPLENLRQRTSVFSRSSATLVPSITGEYTQYGELFVAPTQQPTALAIDIMTRMLLVTGLPSKATLSSAAVSRPQTGSSPYATSSSLEAGTTFSSLSLNLTRSTSCTPSDLADQIIAQVSAAQTPFPVIGGAEAQISADALNKERRVINGMREATAQLVAQRESKSEVAMVLGRAKRLGHMEVVEAVESEIANEVFGSGVAMAEMYR
jgi:hypothetical protein